MDEPIEAPTASTAPTTRVAKPSPPPGSLFRKDVNATVEEGLGYFLQRVSVDPDVVDGKFRGFRIVELRPADYWKGVDLKPGDVVTLVNGMSIERDIDAYQAFQGLRAAPALRVTFLRGGVQRELVYSIVDPGARGPSKPAPGVAPSGEAPKKAPQGGKSG
jgi:type II secretory pathway component PulC